MYFIVWFWVYGRWSVYSKKTFHTKTDAVNLLKEKKMWKLMRILRVTRKGMTVVEQYTRKHNSTDTKLYKYSKTQEKKRT